MIPPRSRDEETMISRAGHTLVVWSNGAQCTCGWDKSLLPVPRWLLRRLVLHHIGRAC